MKKILLIALIGTVMMMGVGCTNKENGTTDKDNTTIENREDDETVVQNFVYFGKVKKIVGNEVEIEIAKSEEMDWEGDVSSETDSGDDMNGDGVVEEIAGTMTSEATMAVDGEVPEVGTGMNMDEISNNKLELEYTGETKTITIPAGANVFSLKSMSESKVSAIKTGAVIRLFATGTEETPVVFDVQIVE